MMTTLVAFSTVVLGSVLPFELPQEIPALKDVRLAVAVTRSADIFTYTYTISNGATSTGQIWHWGLDIRQPSGGATLSSEGIVSGPGFARASSQLNQTRPEVPKMVPVGVFSPPNWGGGLTANGDVSWGSDDESFRIVPGQTLSGFALTTRGLPGIREFGIHPKFLLNVDPDKIKTPADEEAGLKRQSEIKDQIAVYGKTIGPTAPPAVFKPLDFLASLVVLKHQAEALGWVGDPQVVATLDKRLDKVREKLVAHKLPAARGTLKAFIHKVEELAQETREHEAERIKDAEKENEREEPEFLTPEGHALLRFNALYLLDQLPTPKEPDEEEPEEKSED